MKKGFTLTEVIITLVVLGVLALILIPNFAKLMPNDNIIKYQKAFYTLQDIVNDMVNDEGTCQTDNTNSFDNPLQYCSEVGTDADGNPTETPRLLSEEICERLSTESGTVCTLGAGKNCLIIKTTNGMQWAIPNTSLSVAFSSRVKVKLNNETTALTACATDDTEDTTNGVFVITINSNGKVIPTTAGAKLLKENPTDN